MLIYWQNQFRGSDLNGKKGFNGVNASVKKTIYISYYSIPTIDFLLYKNFPPPKKNDTVCECLKKRGGEEAHPEKKYHNVSIVLYYTIF